jgi:hypothetical protein
MDDEKNKKSKTDNKKHQARQTFNDMKDQEKLHHPTKT